MNYKKLFITTLSLLLSICLKSQIIGFERYLEGAFYYDGITTGNNTFLAVGYYGASGLLTEYNLINGDTIQTVKYDSLPEIFAINKTFDNNYIILNRNFPLGIKATKIDSLYNTLWTKDYFIGEIDPQTFEMSQLKDSAYVIIGSVWDSVLLGYKGCFLKTDRNGNLLVSTSFYDSVGVYFYSFAQVTDTNFLVAGSICSPSCEAYLFNINISGDTIWTRNYSGLWAFTQIVNTIDTNFAVIGDKLFKIDRNGNIIWQKSYGSGNLWHVLNGNNNEYYLTGSVYALGNGFSFINTNEQGDTIFTLNMGCIADMSVPFSLIQVDDSTLLKGRSLFRINSSSIFDTFVFKIISNFSFVLL